jgi:hypothetical protein
MCFFYVLCYVSRPLIHIFLQMLKYVLPYKCNCIMISNTFNFLLTLKTRPIRWRTMYKEGISINCCIWNVSFYGAEIWTLRKAGQKYLESFWMWCWRMLKNISWTDRVRNEEVLHRVMGEGNFPQTIPRKNVKWIGHIWRRTCLLKSCYWRKARGKDIRGGKARKKK